jgi:type II secretory pathway component PulC
MPQVAEFKTPVIQVKKTAPKRKIEIMPFPKTAPKDELFLNGIVYSGDDSKKSFVLINNEIYEVGESVNGKKVISITKDEVTLDDNGQPLILNMRHSK